MNQAFSARTIRVVAVLGLAVSGLSFFGKDGAGVMSSRVFAQAAAPVAKTPAEAAKPAGAASGGPAAPLAASGGRAVDPSVAVKEEILKKYTQAGPGGVFDFEEIMSAPLDVTITKSEEKEGVTIEWLEFTSRVVDGKPERVKGLFAYPSKGLNHPGVFWSQGGMSGAGEYFPVLLAKKGYACLNITLDHKMRDAWAAFNTANPKEGNITLLARDQMRGITLLASRPEVDDETLAVAGASYGGFFASLIAGVDPRIKAGFSFFAGGNHDMGTNLPQFTGMKTELDSKIWMATVDPAPGHAKKNVPFLWGIAFDDHWFLLPAVTKTYSDALSPDKRMLIAGNWKHGFSEQIDNQLTDFLDTVLTKKTPMLNQPRELKAEVNAAGQLIVGFKWDGSNPVERAEILVSPGATDNWVGWSLRASSAIPATVTQNAAWALVPTGDLQSDIMYIGQLYDDKGRQTSTVPMVLKAADFAAVKATADTSWTFNAFPADDFSAESVAFFERMGYPFPGVLDDKIKAGQTASRRFDVVKPEPAPQVKPGEKPVVKRPKPARPAGLPLVYNATGMRHKLTLQIRSEKPQDVTVVVRPLPPANFKSDVVRAVVIVQPGGKKVLAGYKPDRPDMEFKNATTDKFQEFVIDIPAPDGPIEGYDILFKVDPVNGETFWVDQLRLEPQWGGGAK